VREYHSIKQRQVNNQEQEHSMEENLIYKIEILQLIESKYNIEIKDEEVENLDTIKNLIDLIKEKI